MPELPEVETIRRSLAPLVEGSRLEHVAILDSRLTRPEEPAAVAARLEGRSVERLTRRGKYLLFALEGGLCLVVHLRMTGAFLLASNGSPPELYRRATLTLDDGRRIAYRDVRRFGTWAVLERQEAEGYLGARLGPEPLSRAFTPDFLGERLAGRRQPLKAALLDQRTVAGLGNIYVDEALWWSRLHPTRHAGSLRAGELVELRAALQKTLRLGIARQGSTLRDYRDPSGAAGRMQDEFRVYGRRGEPCSRCGSPIEKIRVAGRGTWLCTGCQAGRAPDSAACAGGGLRMRL